MPGERVPDSSAPQPPARLQGRIDRLFEANHHPDVPEREYRNREVVEACKAAGREISESHLSELRRGIKDNPSQRTLETLAWFFRVSVDYFTDPAVAADVEAELAVREAKLKAKLDEERKAREDRASAARELQQAIRASGVTRTAHRATGKGMDTREQAAMMRALAQIILADGDDDDDEDD
jgi:transcriptional regulator with XRE-family HTH domain